MTAFNFFQLGALMWLLTIMVVLVGVFSAQINEFKDLSIVLIWGLGSGVLFTLGGVVWHLTS